MTHLSYLFHRSSTYVNTPRNNWASPGNTQGFFKPCIGSPMFTQGPIGLWLSYHKLPICFPQVTHICQTTQGKFGHHQETPRNSSNHALCHQCSFSGPIGLWLKYPYFNHRSPTYVRTPRNNIGITRKIQKKNPGILQTIHRVTNVHSVGPLVFG